MRFDVLTLFPSMVEGPLSTSIMGRARAEGLFELVVHDLRAWGVTRHRSVDDTPYGGGGGMVLRVDVVAAALDAVARAPEAPLEGAESSPRPRPHVVLFEPSGRRFDQAAARRLAELPHVVLLCGHYEGFDARVREHLVDEVLSIGDYVLTGGEYAALVVVDAVARLLPGVLGNAESPVNESFSVPDRLDFPQYTRPKVWNDHAVPEVLFSGNHAAVRRWREDAAARLTVAVRPDLLPELPAEPEPRRRRRPRTPRAPAPAAVEERPAEERPAEERPPQAAGSLDDPEAVG